MPEFLEPNIEIGPTSEEKEAEELVEEAVTSRPEYASGEIKLNFTHQFSSGDILVAKEDERGIASITIQREGKTAVDLGEFLGSGFKFATPTYLDQIENKDIKKWKGKWRGGWPAGKEYEEVDKLLLVGDMKDEKSIITLMHEIGHTQQNADLLQRSLEELKQALAEHQPDSPQKWEKFITSVSESERDAWAKAIRIARTIKHGDGTDLFECFDDLDEFRRFMYGALIGHRLMKEVMFVSSQRSAPRDAWEAIKSKFFGENAYSKERDFLTDLFDKRRLQRKSE